ncbi:MAG: ankyrin repeat domain-containing protein [Gammaproteobacteria bacterium]|nr:ankyrin repeat domain-containing protein [Gammaproteobacteria bacterium]
MACSHIDGCELFVQFALHPALEVWKQHYCYGDHAGCTRFQLSNRGRPVPLTLLPNGKLVTDTGAAQSAADAGATALFNSIVKRRTRMVQSLIRTGVNINATNIEGRTALMAAAEVGAEDIVQVLLESGADPAAQTYEGETAYDLAVRGGHHRVARLLASGPAKPAASPR